MTDVPNTRTHAPLLVNLSTRADTSPTASLSLTFTTRFLADLGNMHHPIPAKQNGHECAEIHDPNHLALVNLPNFPSAVICSIRRQASSPAALSTAAIFPRRRR